MKKNRRREVAVGRRKKENRDKNPRN